jgi:hypothetical protein
MRSMAIKSVVTAAAAHSGARAMSLAQLLQCGTLSVRVRCGWLERTSTVVRSLRGRRHSGLLGLLEDPQPRSSRHLVMGSTMPPLRKYRLRASSRDELSTSHV